MKYIDIPCRAPFKHAAARYFFFLLIALAFYGCAAVEKPAQEDNFLPERARQIREEARSAYLEGDYRKALLSFRDALAIDRRIGGQGEEVSDLIGMGRAYTGLGNSEEARRHLTKAVKKAFSSRDDKGLAEAYAALAESYLKSADYSLALQNVNDAIRLRRIGGRETIELYNLAGLIYLTTGRLEEATAMIDKALKALAASPPSSMLADTYRLRGRILSEKGYAVGAMPFFNKAFDVDSRLGDKKKMALDLWRAAEVLADIARYDEAITRLKKSYLLYRQSGSLEEALRDLDKLVDVYQAMGDEKSVRYYRNMREAVLADMR